MASSSNAFFHTSDGITFIGNDAARGPWMADACHAGPVTGIIARAFELLVTDKQLLKLSVELLKPVPMDGFQVNTEITKAGRAVTTASADIVDLQGKLIATASSLHMVVQDLGEVPTAPFESHRFSDSVPGGFPIEKTSHGLPGFSSGIEVRYPPGHDNSPGPTSIWMKTLPLLEGEEPSAFQKLCPLADCGNGTSRNQNGFDIRFMNPDITIVMHRASSADWLLSSAESHWQPTGLGLAQANLFDELGPIGSVMQTLLLQK
ncbi:thioesterase family protein [Maricurvus nonylphenolicus]|uniref:thioesterase family protein n=1 Tax=Maricurvus nonylphenolicus TaxID=1008307 RepID=UPI0036F3390F